MNELLIWDQFIFYKINTGLANRFFDELMPLLRNPPTWIPFYVFFAVFLIYNFKRKGLYIIAFAIIAIIMSDQLSSSVIKPIVHRLRPCNDPHMVGYVRLVLKNCGAGFSFPSSHAVNHFTFALYIISIFPRQIKWVRPTMLVWASLVAFAQVYVGVHYPLDVLIGAIIGGLIGYLIATICKGIFHIDLDAELEDNEIM
jgi:membrane-associated phospholipid phosphatase